MQQRVHSSKPQIKIGDVFKTNCQGDVVVIYYNHANDIGVRFDNGYERSATSGNLQKGKVKDPTSPTRTHKRRADDSAVVMGKEYRNNDGFTFVPTGYVDAGNIEVTFSSGYTTTVSAQNIRLGTIRDYLSPTKLGVGILGIGEFETDFRKGHESKEYQHWSSMMARSYDASYKARFPTYKDVTTCKEWLNFQVFAKWCNTQKNFRLDNFVLDKDIFIKLNKVYSPETCMFVPDKINSLFTKCNTMRGSLPIGVYFAAKNSKLGACVGIRGKNQHLGFFLDEQDAFNAYKKAKEKHIKDMAEEYKDVITEKCYKALYDYEVEITD